ncbi:ABC transporter permease [Kitasatospora sp. NPDC057198]|uniref:ABC transporter permease n=1 Tax=Kitasatospora sp. NPDC057198 TaxID=3346046 RepID=UPI00362D6D46
MSPAAAAVRALARVEAVRLLRHPAVLAAGALYAVLWARDLPGGDAAHRFPVLPGDVSWSVHLPLLLLAAGVLLAAHQGVLRAHRDGTGPLFDVLLLGRDRRTAAHLLALLPVTALAALLTAVRAGYLAARPGAAGTLSWWELPAGPLCVPLAGAVGVLLARTAHAAVLAPVAVAGLGVLTVAAAVDPAPAWHRLVPLPLADETAAPLPAALADRPDAAHLLWLAALTALAAGCALGRRARPVAACALAVALAAGALHLRGPSGAVAERRAAYTAHPAAYQHCTTLGAVTTCAFPGFEAWTGQWRAVAEGVLRYAPPPVAQARYTVRQRILPAAPGGNGAPLPASWAEDDAAAGTPEAVGVGTDWSAGTAAGERRGDAVAEYATGFAYRAVTGRVPGGPGTTTVCGARAVLVLWLAGSATPGARDALRSVRGRTSGALSFPLLGTSAAGLSFDPRAARVAFELIGARPPVDAAAHWAELAAPDTGVERAAELLGVQAPPAVPAEERTAGC